MPLWGKTKPAPTCEKRKREADDDGEPLNSSFHLPCLARRTNAVVSAGNKAHLLSLPSSIRNYIFHLALLTDDAIPVSDTEPDASVEPGLLKVSQQIRKEAVRIFYTENDFDLRVHDFAVAAVLPWLEKRAKYIPKKEKASGEQDEGKKETSGNAKGEKSALNTGAFSAAQHRALEFQRKHLAVQKALYTPTPGKLTMSINFAPNWDNLVAWLKLFHANRLKGPQEDENDSVAESTAFAAFAVVGGLRGEKWEMVEKVLPGLRAMLGAGEPRWLPQETLYPNVAQWLEEMQDEVDGMM